MPHALGRTGSLVDSVVLRSNAEEGVSFLLHACVVSGKGVVVAGTVLADRAPPLIVQRRPRRSSSRRVSEPKGGAGPPGPERPSPPVGDCVARPTAGRPAKRRRGAARPAHAAIGSSSSASSFRPLFTQVLTALRSNGPSFATRASASNVSGDVPRIQPLVQSRVLDDHGLAVVDVRERARSGGRQHREGLRPARPPSPSAPRGPRARTPRRSREAEPVGLLLPALAPPLGPPVHRERRTA